MPEWARMARVRRCDNLGNPVLAALKQIPRRASWAFRSDADDAQDGVDVEPQPVIQRVLGHQVAFEHDRAGEPVGEIVISDGAVVHRDGHGVEMVSRPRHRLGKHPASVGWTSFSFTWIKDCQMAIYCLVLAAVWQTSGLVMAMFLAGLRGIDDEILKAAQIDGASTFRL